MPNGDENTTKSVILTEDEQRRYLFDADVLKAQLQITDDVLNYVSKLRNTVQASLSTVVLQLQNSQEAQEKQQTDLDANKLREEVAKLKEEVAQLKAPGDPGDDSRAEDASEDNRTVPTGETSQKPQEP